MRVHLAGLRPIRGLRTPGEDGRDDVVPEGEQGADGIEPAIPTGLEQDVLSFSQRRVHLLTDQDRDAQNW
jgi:hypothetical protein